MKCVVLGFGFLAQYILPCYGCLLGELSADNLVAIKATERNIDALRAKYPFPILAGGALQQLERMRPELIVIAVKPKQMIALLQDTLVPYLQRLREEHAALPDIYSFAASPKVEIYTDILGADLNIACMIPNMLREIEGRNIAPVGVSFVSFDLRRSWPEMNRARALSFMEPTGTIVEIPSAFSAAYVALNCACHIMFDFSMIVQQELERRCMHYTLSQLAQAYRATFRSIFDEPCTQLIPIVDMPDSQPISCIMQEFMRGWYRGLMNYCEEIGMPFRVAHRNACGSMEAFLIEVQLETVEQLQETTRLHATPGGYLEKAISTFKRLGEEECRYLWGALLDEEPCSDVNVRIASIAYQVIADTTAHGLSLA